MTRGYQPAFYAHSETVRDRAGRLRQAAKVRHILETLLGDRLRDLTCLDVGCSSGVITATVAPLFARTAGLEFDREALAAIDPTDRGTATFLRGDAMRLPVRSATVDVVICAQVYEHVPDDRLLFSEIDRVLRPGGVLCFSGPNWLFPLEPHYFLPFLHWLPERLADRYLHRVTGESHYYERSRTVWGLRQLLPGYRIQDVTCVVLRQRGHPLGHAPDLALRLLQPLLPNFNWLAQKPYG